jgi:hypothetical protein
MLKKIIHYYRFKHINIEDKETRQLVWFSRHYTLQVVVMLIFCIASIVFSFLIAIR